MHLPYAYPFASSVPQSSLIPVYFVHVYIHMSNQFVSSPTDLSRGGKQTTFSSTTMDKGPHWLASPHESIVQQIGSWIYVPARAFNIIWGNDDRFWKWTKLDDFPQFGDGAELIQVNWLEVTTNLNMSKLGPSLLPTTCQIFWVVKFKVDAFGWHLSPVSFGVASDGKKNRTSKMLEDYKNKTDVWHEIYGGEFTISPGTTSTTVEIEMFDVQSDWWKGSMILGGVILKPK